MTMDFRKSEVIILDSAGNPFPTTLKVDIVSTTVARNPLQWQMWPSTPITISDSTWTDVYTYAGACLVHEALWQLNTEKMLLRLEIDSVVVADLDLDELQDNFELRNSGGGNLLYSFLRYDNKRWVLRPPVSLEAKVDFKIQMKSSSGDKRVERGITTVEPR